MKPTKKQKAGLSLLIGREKALLSIMNCVHYCATGGHLWYHSPRPESDGTPDCNFRTDGSNSTIKFFQVCSLHRRTKKRGRSWLSEDEYD